MNKFLSFLIKLSALPVQGVYFRKKVYCEDGDKKLRKIKGPAIIVSNHTSVYDYPLIMYTFFNKNIRTLVGETMYTHSKALNRMLKHLGAIKVDRQNFNFNFLSEISKCLEKKQVCLIFPESRLHKNNEDPNQLLEFKPSYIYSALENKVPIIPVYTNGIYGKLKKVKKDRARIIIGKPIDVVKLSDSTLTEKENIIKINEYVKNYILKLRDKLEKYKK